MNLKAAGGKGLDWTYLAQYRDKWRTFASTVRNLRFPQNAGNLFTKWRPSCLSFEYLIYSETYNDMTPVTEENHIKPLSLFFVTRTSVEPGTYQTDCHGCTNISETSDFHGNTKLAVFYLVDGGSYFLRNISLSLPHYTAWLSKRQSSAHCSDKRLLQQCNI